jgi:dolichol-phosphate mannosyltransferase
MKTLIIIPTYNEKENIDRLISEIFKNVPDVEILVVDDNSPDGTAQLVEEILKNDTRVHLLKREKKMGLGTAYVAGFKYALEYDYEFIFEMDSDFSHDPKEIPYFLQSIQDCDLVIGSRYITGVNVVNWPLPRLLLSYFANVYTRWITGMPVRDSTSGFKCFRRKVLENCDLNDVSSDGYAFQIEMDFKAWHKGFKVREIPIIFVDRRSGVSKMSKEIVYEAAWIVWKLKIKSILGLLK